MGHQPLAVTAFFLDTSGLFPRYVRGSAGYAWANEICAQDRGNVLGIAAITRVELAATFHQLARGGTIRGKRRDIALALLQDHLRDGEYTVVPISDTVLDQAMILCARHPLKGYDAVQLAWPLPSATIFARYRRHFLIRFS